MGLMIAACSIDYTGRLGNPPGVRHLPVDVQG